MFLDSSRFQTSLLLIINKPVEITSLLTHSWIKSPLIQLSRSKSIQNDAESYATNEHRIIHEHHHQILNNGDYDDKSSIHPLSELQCKSYQPLLDAIPNSVQIVLIGEGTHGTEEFFRIRSEITRALLERDRDGDRDGSFGAILCEGDVSQFLELNDFVTGKDIKESGSRMCAQNNNDIRKLEQNDDYADDGIHPMLTNLFRNSFPNWMWSNTPMESFVSYLKSFNENRRLEGHLPIQLLGMDVQSPFASMDFIIRELTAMGENELATMAQNCYGTLSSFRPNIRQYGDAVYGSRISSQEKSVCAVMDELFKVMSSKKCYSYLDIHEQKIFELLHCARAVVASEKYHRQRIYPGHVTTWNLRTNFFMDSIKRIRVHLSRTKQMSSIKSKAHDSPRVEKNYATAPKLIVWAHNSHIGDMRETGYSSLGQISLGQLCREHFGEDKVFLIGMTTYEGEVRAALADRPGACFRGEGKVQTLTAALDDSHEFILHSVSMKMKPAFGETSICLLTRAVKQHENVSSFGVSGIFDGSLDCKRRERFVGSCYLPQTEIISHYSDCNIARQFDCLFHVDRSSALSVRPANQTIHGYI